MKENSGGNLIQCLVFDIEIVSLKVKYYNIH